MAESPIQSSFIPRDAGASTKRSTPRGGLYDLLLLISIVLFVASAVLAVGVFLYVQFLQTQSASKLVQLKHAKDAFEPALIQKITRLDDRMRIASDLLATHIAPSLVIKALELSTLQTVAYSSFTLDVPDSQNISIKMSGNAQSVNSVALQADLFSKSNLITSPIFSGIDRQGGGVHFTVQALINPSLIRYSSLINPEEGAPATTQQAPVAPEDQSPFTRNPTPADSPNP